MVLKTVGPTGFPEIEESYVVGAIVGAEPGSYTSVVDLYIHAFVIVICCVHWAYWLTRCIAAVLAEHGYETCLHVGELTFPASPESVESWQAMEVEAAGEQGRIIQWFVCKVVVCRRAEPGSHAIDEVCLRSKVDRVTGLHEIIRRITSFRVIEIDDPLFESVDEARNILGVGPTISGTLASDRDGS